MRNYDDLRGFMDAWEYHGKMVFPDMQDAYHGMFVPDGSAIGLIVAYESWDVQGKTPDEVRAILSVADLVSGRVMLGLARGGLICWMCDDEEDAVVIRMVLEMGRRS